MVYEARDGNSDNVVEIVVGPEGYVAAAKGLFDKPLAYFRDLTQRLGEPRDTHDFVYWRA